jgi:hypothetical protein
VNCTNKNLTKNRNALEQRQRSGEVWKVAVVEVCTVFETLSLCHGITLKLYAKTVQLSLAPMSDAQIIFCCLEMIELFDHHGQLINDKDSQYTIALICLHKNMLTASFATAANNKITPNMN